MANRKKQTKRVNEDWEDFKKAFEEAYGVKPETVHGVPTLRTYFYRMQLERILLSIIDITYNEELYNWDEDYMREGILLNGLLAITETDSGVLLPLKCGPQGVNVFNRPTGIIIANPVVGTFEREIGKDCEIIYLQGKQGGRFRSMRSVLDVYAQKLANCDCALDVNVFNSRTPYIFQAPNQNVADSFKAMVDEIGEGRTAVFVDEEMGSLMQNKSGSNIFMFKAKENYVADLIQTEQREIFNSFLTAVGINNANMTKKEREIVDEVNSNNVCIRANIKLFKENIERCVKRVNKMYPDCNLSITFPYYVEEEEQPVDRPEDDKEDKEDEPN